MKKLLIFLSGILLFTSSCNTDTGTAATDETAVIPEANSNVVEVLAKDYSFQVDNDIKSGWTTFKFVNQGEEPHFFLLTKLPEGKAFKDYTKEIVKPFVVVWDSVRMGKIEKEGAGPMLGQLLPEWYANAKLMGGAGIVDPGESSFTTLKLMPGDYVMECYIKMKNGMLHTSMGMIRPITVIQDKSDMKAPVADVNLSLSNEKMDRIGDLKVGKNTIAVTFNEHPQYGLGNDVHLVRLTPETDINEVIEWMDWLNLKGLMAPAPAKFLGGVQEMPVGYTAYFTVDLQPGQYALIGESNTNILEQVSVK